MEWSFVFFLNSALLGVGLAMDAFSVYMANGLHDPKMGKDTMCRIAGTFGVFQAVMPMTGWICVHTIVELFSSFETFIPWIALALLGYIGGKMLVDGIKGEEAEEATESNAALFDVMREALGEKVERVVVSTRLTDAPAVVTSEGGVSLAMVQVLKCQPGAEGLPDLHLGREMNAKHPVFEALRAAHEAGDDDKVRTYAGILCDQALLVEGVMPDNPLAFAQAVSELMK